MNYNESNQNLTKSLVKFFNKAGIKFTYAETTPERRENGVTFKAFNGVTVSGTGIEVRFNRQSQAYLFKINNIEREYGSLDDFSTALYEIDNTTVDKYEIKKFELPKGFKFTRDVHEEFLNKEIAKLEALIKEITAEIAELKAELNAA